MEIIYNKNGTATIDMRRYILEGIEDFPEPITRAAATPAQKDIFECDDTLELLSIKDSDICHSLVAKLLYVSKRARIDIQLAIAFLCTRVSKCNVKDWK